MSTDYNIACFTCKERGPIFASASIAYGYKVWDIDDSMRTFLGHRNSCGKHERHDLRIIDQDFEFDPPTPGSADGGGE